MDASEGGLYKVSLFLANAGDIGPSWLVGAVMATYPGASVLSVEEYSKDTAIIVMKWLRGSGEINEGDTVSVLPEGTQLPGYATPSAVVTEVDQVQAPPVKGPGLPNSLKLAVAGGLMLTVVYFSKEISQKAGAAAG